MNTDRAMRRTVSQKLLDSVFVRKTQNVIEILLCILRVAPGVRTPKYSDCTSGSKEIAQCVCELGSLRERSYNSEIQRFREFLNRIFKTRITDEGDIMSCFFAPYGDSLGHDACQIRVHRPCPQVSCRSFSHKVDDTNLEFPHNHSSIFGQEAPCFRLGRNARSYS